MLKQSDNELMEIDNFKVPEDQDFHLPKSLNRDQDFQGCFLSTSTLFMQINHKLKKAKTLLDIMYLFVYKVKQKRKRANEKDRVCRMQIDIVTSLLTSFLFHPYGNAFVFPLLVEFPHALHATLKNLLLL